MSQKLDHKPFRVNKIDFECRFLDVLVNFYLNYIFHLFFCCYYSASVHLYFCQLIKFSDETTYTHKAQYKVGTILFFYYFRYQKKRQNWQRKKKENEKYNERTASWSKANAAFCFNSSDISSFSF